ncbi:phosphonate ABC transporter, permease protein PhnE [Prosthecomicrobium pneumaticum]|uniref:Phosphonate transport system permease protein n=1 Tax=Prosthecomicrobium pneumaticum TaxID=81895 RepID=A0A7W9L1S0_9HYPH|nr:phosphonate ABC transporter, permease protein PhnE [Prosthecomicrobium pneumaticum]MBB5752949.1 phosphonate transport system permease protein [Prosthecomicrobium pneumaticum]
MSATDVSEDVLTVMQARIAAHRREKRLMTLSGIAIFLLLFFTASWWTDFGIGAIIDGLPKFGHYLAKLFSTPAGGGSAERIPIVSFAHLFGGWDTKQSILYWFYNIGTFISLMLDTVAMAVLATLLGFSIAFLASFPASHNLSPAPWIVWLSRRILEVLRSIPDIVFALFFVFCYGIGPLAGILAMGLHTAGALGKLFSELNENASSRPIEGIRSVGADWFSTIRYAVVPQVFPGFVSYALLRFEINVRSSAIIGVVGAGGIGEEIKKVINFNRYEDISAIVILVVLLVIAIDTLSGRIRQRFIGDARIA